MQETPDNPSNSHAQPHKWGGSLPDLRGGPLKARGPGVCEPALDYERSTDAQPYVPKPDFITEAINFCKELPQNVFNVASSLLTSLSGNISSSKGFLSDFNKRKYEPAANQRHAIAPYLLALVLLTFGISRIHPAVASDDLKLEGGEVGVGSQTGVQANFRDYIGMRPGEQLQVSGVLVAVIDAAINLNNQLPRITFPFGNSSNPTGHGNEVLSILAASQSPNNNVAGIGDFSPNPILYYAACRESSCSAAEAIKAFKDAIQRGARVINMSFGGGADYALWKSAIEKALLINPNQPFFIIAAAVNGPNIESLLPDIPARLAQDFPFVIVANSLDSSGKLVPDQKIALKNQTGLIIGSLGVGVETLDQHGNPVIVNGNSFVAPAILPLLAKAIEEVAAGSPEGSYTVEAVLERFKDQYLRPVNSPFFDGIPSMPDGSRPADPMNGVVKVLTPEGGEVSLSLKLSGYMQEKDIVKVELVPINSYSGTPDGPKVTYGKDSKNIPVSSISADGTIPINFNIDPNSSGGIWGLRIKVSRDGHTSTNVVGPIIQSTSAGNYPAGFNPNSSYLRVTDYTGVDSKSDAAKSPEGALSVATVQKPRDGGTPGTELIIVTSSDTGVIGVPTDGGIPIKVNIRDLPSKGIGSVQIDPEDNKVYIFSKGQIYVLTATDPSQGRQTFLIPGLVDGAISSSGDLVLVTSTQTGVYNVELKKSSDIASSGIKFTIPNIADSEKLLDIKYHPDKNNPNSGNVLVYTDKGFTVIPVVNGAVNIEAAKHYPHQGSVATNFDQEIAITGDQAAYPINSPQGTSRLNVVNIEGLSTSLIASCTLPAMTGIDPNKLYGGVVLEGGGLGLNTKTTSAAAVLMDQNCGNPTVVNDIQMNKTLDEAVVGYPSAAALLRSSSILPPKFVLAVADYTKVFLPLVIR